MRNVFYVIKRKKQWTIFFCLVFSLRNFGLDYSIKLVSKGWRCKLTTTIFSYDGNGSSRMLKDLPEWVSIPLPFWELGRFGKSGMNVSLRDIVLIYVLLYLEPRMKRRCGSWLVWGVLPSWLPLLPEQFIGFLVVQHCFSLVCVCFVHERVYGQCFVLCWDFALVFHLLNIMIRNSPACSRKKLHQTLWSFSNIKHGHMEDLLEHNNHVVCR